MYGAGQSGIGASEFNPDDITARTGAHFGDLTLCRTNKAFTSKEEFVKERDAHPGEPIVIHFLDEDNNPHDQYLQDLAVLFDGTNICTDAVTWTDADGNWFFKDEWPLPKGLQSHPRLADSFTKFLRKWVRERGVLSWMDAIHKGSLQPCLTFGDYAPAMKKKGRLQEGMDADIVVFDPETVTEMSSFKEPCKMAKGMKHVMVNGTFLIRDEKLDTKAMPGQPVRGPIRD